MDIPKLQIRTTDALLKLNIQQPKQHIEQLPAELQIKQPAAELSINSTEGKLLIDASEARKDYGFIPIHEIERRAAQKGYQDLLNGIARRAKEGFQLMNIGKNSNALHSIIDAKTSPKNKPLGIKFIPKADSVKIEYIPTDIQIDIKTNEPIINAKINKPIHNYTPGKTDVELAQYPTINIDWLV
ncbi:DUF6470 family protein [Lysinibacillus sp. BW-2-10]|uniref:DUF6470 family protein n=1 Tax=Lysinibacillus sp. BW-2-10 TaxID=2590030 RepID=UPI00117FE5BB|nr:DUF6470 family protein [Lysinibacillus sp. BW-2-10]TSI07328.1 hypothetical protein FJQ64_08485 [Lysinibacillus sp. BW-2-10]